MGGFSKGCRIFTGKNPSVPHRKFSTKKALTFILTEPGLYQTQSTESGEEIRKYLVIKNNELEEFSGLFDATFHLLGDRPNFNLQGDSFDVRQAECVLERLFFKIACKSEERFYRLCEKTIKLGAKDILIIQEDSKAMLDLVIRC